ncbi:hypothetical protein DERP_007552 [Dermatophagoides pteronyssinus]|uniref:Uncharacterized protein n=1 Tax=Dermatophagoides pteronyssinus TaxID=6956 RepID=A0ABQ8JK26_DERPT|nr:hypothetical protein DERP_007552 [Dermatophagoides pteronyssinus]
MIEHFDLKSMMILINVISFSFRNHYQHHRLLAHPIINNIIIRNNNEINVQSNNAGSKLTRTGSNPNNYNANKTRRSFRCSVAKNDVEMNESNHTLPEKRFHKKFILYLVFCYKQTSKLMIISLLLLLMDKYIQKDRRITY